MRAFSIRRALSLFPVAIITLALLAPPVQAQFGRMIRKATERRVEQKVDDQANVAMLIQPTFDATTIEITTPRLDTYQAAMEKRRAQAAQNRAAAEALSQRATATRDSARVADKPNEREAYEKSTDRYGDCRHGVEHEQSAAIEKKSQALVAQFQANPMAAQNDPKVKEMMALMQAMGAAQARGDTAEARRSMERLQSSMGGAVDSASVEKAAASKCGARPSKPAGMLRARLLNARADSIELQGRALSGAGTGVRGAEVGMTDVQSRMFWERIQSWLTGMRKDAPITITFTRAEYDLLVSRRAALRKAFNGSE